MNIQEDEKKPVYEIHESVTITKQHFDWLNHEVLRIGHLARQYSDQGDLLRAELKLLRYEKIHDLGQLGETQAEVTFLKSKADYLKAEVERLRNTDPNSISGSTIMSDPDWSIACFRFHRENERAEIARLRKAGDNLERVLTTKVASYEVANASHEWNAAKEGKPSV